MTQPQPGPPPYYTPPVQPHSHEKYLLAIAAVGVIAVIVGAAIGYGLGSVASPLGTSSLQQQFTFTHGTVDIGQSGVQIFFDNQNTGTLASPIFKDNTYQLYLVSGKVYQVTIYWDDSTTGSTRSCAARPQPFTPTGSDYSQNFLC